MKLTKDEVGKRLLATIAASKKSGVAPDMSRLIAKDLKQLYRYDILSPVQKFELAMCEGNLELAQTYYPDYAAIIDERFEMASRDPDDTLEKELLRPIKCAIENGHLNVLQYVLGLRAENSASYQWDLNGPLLIGYAIKHRRADIARYLILLYRSMIQAYEYLRFIEKAGKYKLPELSRLLLLELEKRVDHPGNPNYLDDVGDPEFDDATAALPVELRDDLDRIRYRSDETDE